MGNKLSTVGKAIGAQQGGVFRGVGFDLDGTLYPNYRLYLRILPYIFRHPRFLSAFNSVRSELHHRALSGDGAGEAAGDFYEVQAALMGKILQKDTPWVKERMETLVYRRWEEHFSGIGLFPHVEETLAAFRAAGLRLGLLSDFPPGRKLELLGLGSSFDTVLSTEQTGFLKPHGEPFRRFSEALGIPPEEILYVGNSPRLDAGGALAAGMGAALIQRGPFSTGMYKKKKKQDCFTFSAYRQLQEYVLG